jgi:CMP-N-acetylneuraminic acid synthetase
MIAGKRILAVVPARSGSKGIPDKNLQRLAGRTLIEQVARVLSHPDCGWIDRKIISTDSPVYAEEAKRHGLEVPFLRPAELSTDTSTAVEALQHAVHALEAAGGGHFDIVLIVEPTSPLRLPEDVRRVAEAVASSQVSSALTVSRVDTKFHPLKVFRRDEREVISYYSDGGNTITRRQQLEPLYFRNGAAYALTRALLLEEGRVFGDDAIGVLVERELVNVDEPQDLAYAQWLIETERAKLI